LICASIIALIAKLMRPSYRPFDWLVSPKLICHSRRDTPPLVNGDTSGSTSFERFSSGTRMRTIALSVLLCALSGAATAQTTNQCPPTLPAGELLNCYNGTAPPHTRGKPNISKATAATERPAAIRGPIDKPAPKNPTDGRAPYVDMLDVENKKLDAKLKTLCRGC